MIGPVNFIEYGLPARWYYRKLGFRAPKKGEWYLSGAIVEAYKAPNDLTIEYMIVEKAHKAKTITIEVPA